MGVWPRTVGNHTHKSCDESNNNTFGASVSTFLIWSRSFRLAHTLNCRQGLLSRNPHLHNGSVDPITFILWFSESLERGLSDNVLKLNSENHWIWINYCCKVNLFAVALLGNFFHILNGTFVAITWTFWHISCIGVLTVLSWWCMLYTQTHALF